MKKPGTTFRPRALWARSRRAMKTALIFVSMVCVSLLAACGSAGESTTATEQLDPQKKALADKLRYMPLNQFIHENVTLMGTIIMPPFLVDVTGDGYEDLCAAVMTGSGIVSCLIAVYDEQTGKGYLLHDRMKYNYWIDAVEDGTLVVSKSVWGSDGPKEKGTVRVEGDELVFVNR